MHDVFISYSSKNVQVADAICHHLEDSSVRCWYAPRNIGPGDEWTGAIVNAIDKAKIFVFVFSEESNSSPEVEREVVQAVKNGCDIIPFRIADVQMSANLSYYLQSIHWLDAITDSMEKSIEHLGDIVRAKMGIEKPDTTPEIPDPEIKPQDEKEAKEEKPDCKEKEDNDEKDESPISDSESSGKEKAKKRKKRSVIIFSVLIILAIFLICNIANDSTVTNEDSIPRIHFENLTETADYLYTFQGLSGFSMRKNMFFTGEKESGNFALIKTTTGEKMFHSNEIDISDAPIRIGNIANDIWVCMSEESDIAYFIDADFNTIGIYDRNKQKWLNNEQIELHIDDSTISMGFVGLQSLTSDIISEDDLFLMVYDLHSKVHSYILHITPEGNLTRSYIFDHNIKEFICGFDIEMSKDNMVPVLAWTKSNKLILIDLLTGNEIDKEFPEFFKEYMPFINADNKLVSANGKYLKREIATDSGNVDFEVWDVQSGKKVFDDTFVNNASSFFSGNNKLLIFDGGYSSTLYELDLETGNKKEVINKSDFMNNHIFKGIPYAFYYSDKLKLKFFASGYSADDGAWAERLIVVNEDGDVVYLSDDLDIPFDDYWFDMYVGDDFILYSTNLISNENKPKMSSIVRMATYTTDKNGNIKFSETN